VAVFILFGSASAAPAKIALPTSIANISIGGRKEMSEERTAEQIKEWLEYLQGNGYNLVKRAVATDNRVRVKTDREVAGKTIKLGIVADTHLCSKWQQLTYLEEFYRYCAKRKVVAMLHCGDLVSAEKVYLGHEYEIFIHGGTEQAEYAVKNYPKITGVKTYIIAGNHDTKYLSLVGFDLVKYVCDRRPDMEMVGYYGGTIEAGPLKAYLLHCDGSVP